MMDEVDRKNHPLYGLLKLMAVPSFDADAYAQSASFAGIVENQAVMAFMDDEGGEAARAYWRARGLKKELHDAETLQTKWASYLPLSAERDDARTYPLLLILHGAGNPILLAESYGYTAIVAREQLIAIIPEDETPESIERLLAYARAHYPVDWSRVYLLGYSLGGFMALRHAMRWPERFAGVGSGGMLFANGIAPAQVQAGQVWRGEDISCEMVRRAAQYRMPCCVCMGDQEVLGLLPVTQDEPESEWETHLSEEEEKRGSAAPKQARIDLSAKNKIASLNNLRMVNGCKPIPEERVHAHSAITANIVEEKIGFPFERTEVAVFEARSHLIGDSVDEAAECRLRVIALQHSPHWPSQALAELTWAFLRRFTRDTETGASVCKQG